MASTVKTGVFRDHRGRFSKLSPNPQPVKHNQAQVAPGFHLHPPVVSESRPDPDSREWGSSLDLWKRRVSTGKPNDFWLHLEPTTFVLTALLLILFGFILGRLTS